MATCQPVPFNDSMEMAGSGVTFGTVPLANFPPGATKYRVIVESGEVMGATVAFESAQFDAAGRRLTPWAADSHSQLAYPQNGALTDLESGAVELHWVMIATAATGPSSYSVSGYVYLEGDCNYDYCAYGSQQNPDANVTSLITESMVGIAIGVLAVYFGWTAAAVAVAETAMAAIVGSPMIVIDCTKPPPAMPAGDFWSAPSIDWLMKVFGSAMWHVYCECVPAPAGQPVAIDFPIGDVATPITDPSAEPPTFTCDDVEICTLLKALSQQIAGVSASLALVRRDVELIQRQHVPFAYVPGPRHAPLSGTGQFVVSDILGLSVYFTTVPSTLGSDMDSIATSSYFFGWLNLGTPDGWQRKLKVTHNPFLVLDVNPSTTIVEFTFIPGVTGGALELVREP